MSIVTPVLNSRYKILKEIASGGMGAVYEAEDLTPIKQDDAPLFNKVAVKEYRISGENYYDETTRNYYRKAFEHEARLLETLQHDCLPRFIDHFAEGDGLFFVMQLIEGDDLWKASRKRQFSLTEVLDWAEQLLVVLEYLHTQQPPVIHRDIKPHNLKITPEGRLKLIDFGLAKGSAKGMTSLPYHSIVGYTPNFASIEQILRDNSSERETTGQLINPERVQQLTAEITDARSDLYSVGSTFYYLLTKETPPQATTRLLIDPLRPVQTVNPQIPQPIAEIIHKAMQIDRGDRYSSAAEMRAHLQLASSLLSLSLPHSTVAVSPLSPESKTIVMGAPFQHLTFEISTVDAKGEVIGQRQGLARFYAERLDNSQFTMLEIPEGKFLMGASREEAESSNSERPQHWVNLSAFFMSQSPVTQGQWQTVAELPKVQIELPKHPAYFSGDDRAIESVTWEEAMEFCARLTQKTGNLYRLPTEAEWEYACRAGTQTPFHCGATTMPNRMNYDINFPYSITATGKSRLETLAEEDVQTRNAFGLCGMHGNVWEWCLDWYGDYPGYEVTNPEGPSTGFLRIIRGGGWNTSAAGCRSASRGMTLPNSSSNNLGFRVVRAIL